LRLHRNEDFASYQLEVKRQEYWSYRAESVVLSDKDRQLPRLRDLPYFFKYESACQQKVIGEQ
jgi:hypothetical protein